MSNFCLCGCGSPINKNKYNRKYKYILGHNRRGKVLSEKTKALISKNKCGFKHSEKSKNNISLNHRDISGRKNPCYGLFGKKHPKYKKPEERLQSINRMIRGLEEMDFWIKCVLKRDKYTCQNCGVISKKFNVHHIISVSCIIKKHVIKTTEDSKACKLLWDINNGITYCVKCHRLLNNKGGLLKINSGLPNDFSSQLKKCGVV